MARPLAYISCAWNGQSCENREQALQYSRQVYDAGYIPLCPSLLYEKVLKADSPQEHKDYLEISAELLRRCRLVVVCGSTASEPAKRDIALAKRLHIAATTLDGILTVEGKALKQL